MRIAFLCVVREQWASVQGLLGELRSFLAGSPDLQPSLWLIDDSPVTRPPAWAALGEAARGGVDLHVIELQGRQSAERALAAALGYLVCEHEPGFDAFLLLEPGSESRLDEIPSLLEALARNPDAAVTPGRSLRAPEALRATIARWSVRLCTGQRVERAELLLLPAPTAEILCHSPYSANHLSAAITRLGIPRIQASAARRKGRARRRRAPLPAGRAEEAWSLRALSVFREQCARRAIVVLLFLLVATPPWIGVTRGPGSALLAACALLALLPLAVLLGLSAFSMSELRRWTPALDSATLIRAVTHIKSEPYIVSTAFLGR